MKSKDQNKNQDKKKKQKQYRSPRLVTYGDFRNLTRSSKGGTKQDGSPANPPTKA